MAGGTRQNSPSAPHDPGAPHPNMGRSSSRCRTPKRFRHALPRAALQLAAKRLSDKPSPKDPRTLRRPKAQSQDPRLLGEVSP